MKPRLMLTVLITVCCWLVISLFLFGGRVERLWHHLGQAIRFDEEFMAFSCFLLFSVAVAVHIVATGWTVSYRRRFLFPELGIVYSIAVLILGSMVRRHLRYPEEALFQIIYPLLVVGGYVLLFGRPYILILRREGGEPDAITRRVTILALTVIVTVVALVLGPYVDHYMFTGSFTSKRIVETLQTPVTIASVSNSGLQTVDGGIIRLPSVSNIVAPVSVAKDILEHGVEIQSNGRVYALIRVHHWCGNDPVRFHLARLDLSSLLLVLEEQKHARVTEYGIDPGIWWMAKVPYQELDEFFLRKSSEPDSSANGSQPIR